MKKYLVLLLVGLMAFAHAGKVYIYKDASGKTVYSDQPPQGVDYQQKKLTPSVIDTSGYPYEVQQAIKNFPVILWANACGPICDNARQLLDARGIPYTSKDPGASAEQLESFKKLTGSNAIPVLQIGSRILPNFSPDAWNAALSSVGYPKTASKAIRAPAGTAATAASSTR